MIKLALDCLGQCGSGQLKGRAAMAKSGSVRTCEPRHFGFSRILPQIPHRDAAILSSSADNRAPQVKCFCAGQVAVVGLQGAHGAGPETQGVEDAKLLV